MGVIYKATNTKTGMSYIGQTVDFQARKNRHIKDAEYDREKDTSVFHKSIRIHGADSFTWEILEECPKELLDEREIYWIDYFDTYNNGYNMTPGGENADKLLEWKRNNPKKVLEHNIKCVEKMKKWNEEHPEEYLSNLSKGREWKKSHKKETREVGLRCVKYAHQWQKEHPEEFQRVLQNNIKKAQDSLKIKVRCVELDIVFESMSEAERWSKSENNPNGKKASRNKISSVCKNTRNTAGGYHWEYVVNNP